ncbi:transcriptional regulator, AlpA family [Shimia gijangensis]|uniref:Transcriptional regulator, AlpA family n=1 Tax=Shimia gijangensis TaxID=1470563 RepID=A0A1M6U7T5_9RHOB|nr:AlpA family transcriptional regulator [Shimia gijangensis]SHK65216.1 transcriptional regulator, AlpA family [Shimia gijangensis]
MKLDDTDRLLSRSDVAIRFGIPKRYLEIAAMRGEGPRIVRIGRLVRYRVKDIKAWIEANTSPEAV